jgi:hypothetical protein
MLEELQRRAQPLPPAPPPIPVESRDNGAELERQRKLADEIRALEEARALTQRRASAAAAAQQAAAEAEPAQRSAARGKLMVELRDPQALKRAFVLREVLGPPVGLR